MATTLKVTADAQPECIPALRDFVAQLARAADFSDTEAYAVKTCVGEALDNVVLHAYPTCARGLVSVSVRVDGDELEVAVADEGGCVHELRDEQDELRFGLTLVTRLARHCTFTAAPDGTTVAMQFSHPHRPMKRAADTRQPRVAPNPRFRRALVNDGRGFDA